MEKRVLSLLTKKQTKSRNMDYQKLQLQYDEIYSYFKTTCEPFDFLDWDGKILQVVKKDITVEEYSLKDLKSIGLFSKIN